MTNEEAIKNLTFTKGLEDTLGNFDGGIKNSDLSKSLAMAIKALGHQPCDDCISRQQAIDAVRKAYENDEMFDGYEHRLGELPSVQPEIISKRKSNKNVKSKMDGHTDTSYEWAETVRMAIKALEQTRWIPIIEKPPEVGSEVLVCYDFKGKRSVYIADFYGDGDFHGLDDEYLTSECRKNRKAVAWMPLPKPYEPQESEVEDKE